MPLLPKTFESFGLDIGAQTVKFAYIKKRGSQFTLKAYGTRDVPAGVFDGGVIKDPDGLTSTIKALLKQKNTGNVHTPYVHACLPEPNTFIKVVPFKKASPKELETRIRESLPKHIPLNPKDMYVDWRVIESINNEQNVYVLLGAIDRETSDTYTSVLCKAGLKPVSLQIEAEPIIRSLFPPTATFGLPIAILDLGATRSSFICYDKGIVQYTVSMPLASSELTDLVQAQLQLTRTEAESAKKVCGVSKTRCDGALIDILTPQIDAFVRTIEKNIAFYKGHFSYGDDIKTFVLCGGGSHMPGLRELLAEKLNNATIYHGNPLLHLSGKRLSPRKKHKTAEKLDFLHPIIGDSNTNNGVPLSKEVSLAYTTAIGLALSHILSYDTA